MHHKYKRFRRPPVEAHQLLAKIDPNYNLVKKVQLDKNFKFSLLIANELHYAELSVRMKLSLKPSTDEIELLRIHGQLNNFPYDEPIKNPIALHSKSKITKLYAEQMHRNLGHQGYRVVMVNLRQNGIHILHGKQLLKSIAAKCITCRIAQRKSMEQQMDLKNYLLLDLNIIAHHSVLYQLICLAP